MTAYKKDAKKNFSQITHSKTNNLACQLSTNGRQVKDNERDRMRCSSINNSAN